MLNFATPGQSTRMARRNYLKSLSGIETIDESQGIRG